VCFGHTTAAPCSSAANWKTILVAGLNAGGRGFYALDITDPNNPKGLWEAAGGTQALVGGSVKCLTNAEANSGLFSVDCNIGLSFGNPVIAKRAEDGKWVVFITSGYNNVNPGSGLGYLYMVDAQTGKILRRMTTGVGCAVNNDPDGACVTNTDDPSGLARINAWVDSATTDNTAKAIYGGDLKGNLWRFQLDNTTAVPRYSVTRLASVVADGNVVQPITVRPDLATVSNNRVIYFGTGKFLGDSDKASLTRQSIYAIKDDLSGVVSPQFDMAPRCRHHHRIRQADPDGGHVCHPHRGHAPDGEFRLRQGLVHRPAGRRHGRGGGRAGQRRPDHPARYAGDRLECAEYRNLPRRRLGLGQLPRHQERRRDHGHDGQPGEREDLGFADRRHQHRQDRRPDQDHRHHCGQPAAHQGHAGGGDRGDRAQGVVA